ncbi:DUF6252 family protein [uncultured Dokdonia sp.]|uniref:DUF6252 family protein n=1 Tax=uncultured Dokdonia sp. TaxID=575653 RepID=UPI0026125AA9|nr:DUF6252 family protein [uncultured Dokdonia sp.]
MKRLLPILLLSLFAFSCSNEIQDNSPAFQAVKDSILFRSADSRAVFNDNGSLLIQGNSDVETLNILINSLNQTQIELGGENPNTNIASFTDEFGNVFSTASTNADGQVNYQINGDNTVSGTFNFTALRNGIQDTITLSQGFMFEIPILTELGETPDMNTNDSFTARVNSVIFNPTIIATPESGNVLSVVGQTQQASITVIFPTDIAAGTYDITIGGNTRASYLVAAGNEMFEAQSGTLTIVANDTDANEVSGEFVFDAGSFSITDGEFSVSY